MAKNKTTIGKLIESEVRKQQIPITEFAKLICCQRNNVYDIFKRSKIDIVQLKQISKVLKRNFFKELADDIELISEDDISEKEVLRQKAVSQFFEIVPNILHELGKPSTIVFCKLDVINSTQVYAGVMMETKIEVIKNKQVFQLGYIQICTIT